LSVGAPSVEQHPVAVAHFDVAKGAFASAASPKTTLPVTDRHDDLPALK
jgi:hypothetical protein